jgi:RHS repeat-associated protein
MPLLPRWFRKIFLGKIRRNATVRSRRPGFDLLEDRLVPSVSLRLLVPSSTTYGVNNSLQIQYTNTGSTAVAAPLLLVSADKANLWLPTDPQVSGHNLMVLAIGPTGPAGLLAPGAQGTIQVNFSPTSNTTNTGINFSLSQMVSGQTIDWPSLQVGLRPSDIPSDAWNALFPIFTNNVGSTTDLFQATLDADATYLGQLGEPTSDAARLITYEITKADAAFPAAPLASSVDDSLPTTGPALSFTRQFLPSIADRYTQGTLGRGWVSNWDITASTDAQGNVTIDQAGTIRFFTAQNGGYVASPGDHGTLAAASGGYLLTDADGTITRFNADGTLNSVLDSHGNSIVASYSGGRLSQLTASNGSYLAFSYTNGRLTTLTDSAGGTVSYIYEGQRLLSATGEFGTTTYSYVAGQGAAADGALKQIAFPDGTHLFFSYDSQGRLQDEHEDNNQEDLAYSYGLAGGYTITNGVGAVTTLLTDDAGRVCEAIDALNNVSTFTYDAAGNLTQVVGPQGAVYQYSYDARGNLTSQTDPLGQTTTFSYNAANDLTGSTDGKGKSTTYLYDGQNDLLAINYPNGTQATYGYNPLGQATQFVDANGNGTSYTYDSQGDIATEHFADGSTYSYTYDDRGNLLTATNGSDTITFQYQDSKHPDLVTEIDYPNNLSLKFTYNAAGERLQSVDQTGYTLNYTYDAQGRLEELDDGDGHSVVRYTYDKADELIQKDMGNGTRTTYAYNGVGEVVSISNLQPDHVTVSSFDTYTYDTAGNVLTDTNRDGQWCYTYDAAGQLTGANFALNSSNPDKLPSQNLQYNYDAAGDRTSSTANGVTTTYTTNNVNEYTNSTTAGTTTTYQYDNNGNLTSQTTSGSTTTYTYNDFNQLTGVIGPAHTTSYTYDALGNRNSETIDGTTSQFLIDPVGLPKVVSEYTADGNLIAHYDYGLSLVSQVEAGGQAAYYNFDRLGDTTELTGDTGTSVSRYTYLPFGQATTIFADLPNPFTFVGAFSVSGDCSGLYHMDVRSYDPIIGQFTQNDPTGLSGGDSNQRRYVFNDPTDAIDPTGRSAITLENTAVVPGVPSNSASPAPRLDWFGQAGLEAVTAGYQTIEITTNLWQQIATAKVTIVTPGSSANAVFEGIPATVAVGSFVWSGSPPPPASNFTATTVWSDGLTTNDVVELVNQSGGASYVVFATRVFAEAGNFTGTTTLQEDGLTLTAQVSQTVLDAPLVVNPVNVFVPAGQHYIGPVATFQDFNPIVPAGDFTAYTVNGATNVPATIVPGSANPSVVTANLDFSNYPPGTFNQVVGVWDVNSGGPFPTGGTLLADTVTVVRSLASPFSTSVATPIVEVNSTAPYNGVLAVITTTDPAITSASQVMVAGASPGGTVSASFVVTGITMTVLPGGIKQFTVQGIVNDESTGSGPSTLPMFVNVSGEPALTAQLGVLVTAGSYTVNPLPVTAVAGQPLRNVPLAILAGPASAAYAVTIAWGDGDTSLGFVTPLGGGQFAVSGSKPHPYAAQGSDSITLTVATPDLTPLPPVQATALVSAPPLPSVPEDSTNPAGTSISVLLQGHSSDPDPNTQPGLAVTQLNGNGTWQYFNGRAWINMGSVSQSQALLLPATDQVRFVPALHWTGQASMTYFAWDGSQGSAGSKVKITTTGGATAFSFNSAYATVTVTPVNHAPVWVGGAVAFTPILPGSTNPAGDSVSSIFGASFTDIDPNTIPGLAVTFLNGSASGTWQYSTNGGSSWLPFGVVSTSAARLLSGNDLIRFVPNAGFTSTVTLQGYAWDGSTGSDGGVASLIGKTGGGNAFGTTPLFATLAVNTAPSLAATPGPVLSPIDEDVVSAPVTAGTLLSLAGYSDPDAGALKGIAVVGASGPGTWQYSLNGLSWQALPAVSESSGLLLAGNALLRFVPALHQTGEASLTYRAWDQTAGTSGRLFAINSTGGATAFSAMEASALLSVNPVNHAPVWVGGAVAFTPILPGSTNPAGDSVSSIFGASFTDIDPNTTPGLAVTFLNGSASGTWQYSFDGLNWFSFGAVSTGAARLLSGNDLIRFVPKAGFAGTVTLQGYAWDGSTGSDGGVASLIGKTGGRNAFGTTPLAATLAVNTAPTLAITTGLTLAPTNEDVVSAPVTANTLLSLAGYSDPDAGALKGIAVVGASGPGTWQYSLNGLSWQALPAVSESSGLLLAGNGCLRFVPAVHQTGQASLTYRAWDQTAGTSGRLFAINSTGGATAFSDAEATITLTVRPVNHAPVWVGGAVAFTPILPGSTNPAGDSVSSIFGASFTDIDPNTTPGLAVTFLNGSASGTWQYSFDGLNWFSFGAVSTGTARLLSGNDLIRFVPNGGFSGIVTLQGYAWDGSSGNDGGVASLIGKTGGGNAFGTTPLTATLAVNTAPTLAITTGLTLAPTNEDVFSAPVTAGTLLSLAGYSDPDAGALKGIAVVGASGPGTWQYSLNGLSWQALPAVSESSGLLLAGNGCLRFVPALHQTGQASLTYRAWDQTAGTSGRLFAINSTGGATAFSDAEATATLNVLQVNHTPVWAGSSATFAPVLPGSTNPAGQAVASIFGASFNDIDPGTTVGIAVTGLNGTANGTWQYSTDHGQTWQPFGLVSPLAALLLSGTDLIRFVPNAGFVGPVTLQAFAWDGSSGIDGGVVSLLGNGKPGVSSAFGTTPLTATLVVNTAPTLRP